MKIVFGTDFSEKASNAGRVAAAMAFRWKDTLIVAHALNGSFGHKLPQNIKETLAAYATDRLHSEACNLARTGLHIEEHMLAGSPDLALHDLAKREETRLMLVASLGHRRGEWLLGSVAERVAGRGSIPALVVRDAAPFEAWLRGERPLNVFVAFDFTQTAEKALRWVKHLQAIGACQIVIGYVDWPLADESRLGLRSSPLAPHNPPQVQEILTRELRNHASKLLQQINVSVRCEPSLGRPDTRLIEMAAAEKADLIVTGTHHREPISQLWHGSVARALLRSAPMNVLCVPASCEEPISVQNASIYRALAAVDLSEHGGTAVPFAYEIVRNGGVVRLVHVATPFELNKPLIGGYPSPVPSTKEEHAEMLVEMRKQMNTMISQEALRRGITVEIEVIEAHDIAKAIRQDGERFGADVICVGAHKRSAISRTTLGSVAQAVTTDSVRPVLVVHHKPL